MDKIAVLIPCYNESKSIEKVVSDFRASLPESSIYVYDNNSRDNTAELAKNAGAIVRHERQQGKGFVVRRMFREIDAECYILVDGDDQCPVEYAGAMCQSILQYNNDMVIGDRLSTNYFDVNTRKFHGFGNTVVKKVINTLFNAAVKDVMCGYRAFSYLFVKSFPAISHGFEIETELTIYALDKRLAISDIPITVRDRATGSVSSLNTIRDGIKIMMTILRLYKNYKPFNFFGIISIVLLLTAAIFFIPIFITYLKISAVPNFPTLIVCGFVVIAALQSVFSGLILSSIKQKNDHDFEFQLLKVYNDYKERLR